MRLVHPASLDRAHLPHRSLGEHHAAGVDAQMTRSSQQLISKIDDRLRDVVITVGRDASVGVDLGGPGILLAGRVASALAMSRTADFGR